MWLPIRFDLSLSESALHSMFDATQCHMDAIFSSDFSTRLTEVALIALLMWLELTFGVSTTIDIIINSASSVLTVFLCTDGFVLHLSCLFKFF